MDRIFRFFNRRTGEHFYTQSTAERNGIIAGLPDFSYEGVSFLGSSGSTPASVARFVRLDTGTHFYTASAEERDYVQRNLSAVYRLESTAAFQVSSSQDSTFSQAVHRFYDATSGSHFLTASDAERDVVAAALPNYRYEGIAYYVVPTQPMSPTPTGALDEAWYLLAYPDVRDAVNAGTITVRVHYEAFGRLEGRMPNDMAALVGNDRLIAYDSAPGFVRVLNGGSGNDVLEGIDAYPGFRGSMFGGLSDYYDRLFGETGDDTLYGAQRDSLNGGTGDDVYYVHAGGVSVTEGSDAGNDTVYVLQDYVSGAYDYALPARVEFMRLTVNDTSPSAPPTFTGGSGNDWISGGSGSLGSLRLIGGAGNDTLNGGGGGTYVEGGAGNDHLLAASHSSGMLFSGNDTLDGGSGNDTLVAWSGNDRLTGGADGDAFLFDPGGSPQALWQDTLAPASAGAFWNEGSVTAIADFEPGIDTLSFRHSTLGLSEIMARFQDRTGGSPGVQATFTTDEFGLATPAGYTRTFTVLVEGFSRSQLSANWFSVSSG